MSEPDRPNPLRVVIAGGGVAALEVVLALHELAESRVHVTLIAPNADFVLPALRVADPFARGHANPLALIEVMREHGGDLVRDRISGVDAEAHTVQLEDGPDLPYDVLVVALGATPVPAFAHVLTFGADPIKLNGVLADLEEGYSQSVAFVVPRGCTWPLPLYELALMTAEQVWSMNMDRVKIHFVTPELKPLELFGAAASAGVRELLIAAKIVFHHGVSASITNGRIATGFGADIVVDRIVALPLLEGPELVGLPVSERGFIPVDDHGWVTGLEDVYAVGDATERPIKQGGLACQQADVTAAHIAARAGASVEVPVLEQVLRGRLLTGGNDRFLQRSSDEPRGEVGIEPLWWSSVKFSGRYLSPYLLARGAVHLPPHTSHHSAGIDVRVPLTWQQVHGADILGLSPLSPTSTTV